MIYMRSVFDRAKILSTIETKQVNYHIFANEPAERRRSPCEAASLMPREVLQQAEKFSIVL